MIGPGLVRELEITAKEGSAELSDKFLHGVGFSAEAAGEIAVEAMLRPGPMNKLMQRGGVVALGRAGRGGADEAFRGREADLIGAGIEIGAITTVMDDGTRAGDELLGS